MLQNRMLQGTFVKVSEVVYVPLVIFHVYYLKHCLESHFMNLNSPSHKIARSNEVKSVIGAYILYTNLKKTTKFKRKDPCFISNFFFQLIWVTMSLIAIIMEYY